MVFVLVEDMTTELHDTEWQVVCMVYSVRTRRDQSRRVPIKVSFLSNPSVQWQCQESIGGVVDSSNQAELQQELSD